MKKNRMRYLLAALAVCLLAAGMNLIGMSVGRAEEEEVFIAMYADGSITVYEETDMLAFRRPDASNGAKTRTFGNAVTIKFTIYPAKVTQNVTRLFFSKSQSLICTRR